MCILHKEKIGILHFILDERNDLDCYCQLQWINLFRGLLELFVQAIKRFDVRNNNG